MDAMEPTIYYEDQHICGEDTRYLQNLRMIIYITTTKMVLLYKSVLLNMHNLHVSRHLLERGLSFLALL